VLSALAAGSLLAVPTLASCSATSTLNQPSSAVEASRPVTTRVSTEALTALVADRFRAVAHGDRVAWLAALAPDVDQPERSAQGRIFDRMRAMHVTDLHVVSVVALPAVLPSSAAGTSTTTTARASTTATTTFASRARLTATYRLDGFDTAPRTFVVDLTLDGAPEQSAAAAGAAPRLRTWAPAERPQPWDLEGLRIRRTADALLLVVGTEAQLAELAQRAHVAARRVTALWGGAEPSVWVAPGTNDDAARLLGRTAGAMTGVAAVTDGPLEPGTQAGADRIVIVPQPWAGLSGAGRDVVLTHELTHATVRASTTRSVPDWLAEGFAELVAYRSLALPEREVVAPALDLVRSRGLPTALPTDADFDPAAGRLEAAYGLSLLAVRELADQHGTAALVRLYRDAAGALPVPADSLDNAEAIANVALARIGTDRTTLVRQWRARIAALLAP
jgi:hypothetical protein